MLVTTFKQPKRYYRPVFTRRVFGDARRAVLIQKVTKAIEVIPAAKIPEILHQAMFMTTEPTEPTQATEPTECIETTEVMDRTILILKSFLQHPSMSYEDKGYINSVIAAVYSNRPINVDDTLYLIENAPMSNQLRQELCAEYTRFSRDSITQERMMEILECITFCREGLPEEIQCYFEDDSALLNSIDSIAEDIDDEWLLNELYTQITDEEHRSFIIDIIVGVHQELYNTKPKFLNLPAPVPSQPVSEYLVQTSLHETITEIIDDIEENLDNVLLNMRKPIENVLQHLRQILDEYTSDDLDDQYFASLLFKLITDDFLRSTFIRMITETHVKLYGCNPTFINFNFEYVDLELPQFDPTTFINVPTPKNLWKVPLRCVKDDLFEYMRKTGDPIMCGIDLLNLNGTLARSFAWLLRRKDIRRKLGLSPRRNVENHQIADDEMLAMLSIILEVFEECIPQGSTVEFWYKRTHTVAEEILLSKIKEVFINGSNRNKYELFLTDPVPGTGSEYDDYGLIWRQAYMEQLTGLPYFIISNDKFRSWKKYWGLPCLGWVLSDGSQFYGNAPDPSLLQNFFNRTQLHFEFKMVDGILEYSLEKLDLTTKPKARRPRNRRSNNAASANTVQVF